MKWPIYKLDQLCMISTGRTPSRSRPDYFGGEHVWVTIADLNDDLVNESKEGITDIAITDSNMRPVAPGTVLLSYKLSLGKLGIAEIPLYTNEAIAALTPRSGIKLTSKFLFYALKTINYFELCHGAVKGNCLNRASLSNIQIPLPSFSEQHLIIEILNQADALRKKRSEADAKAERILPVLFYKMFGDPALNTKGWEKTTLIASGASVRYGLGQPPKSDSNGLPLIRATNIRRGMIYSENMLYVNPNDVPQSRNAYLQTEDIIVVRSGAYTGDVAQVTEKWAGAVAGYDLIVSPGINFTGEFIETYLLTSHIQNNYFGNLKARAGQPHLNSEQVSNTPIYKPPKSMQASFSEKVNRIRKYRERIKKCDEQINKLFTIIIYRAFSGDLTAKWREAHMKELLTEMEEQAKCLSNEVTT